MSSVSSSCASLVSLYRAGLKQPSITKIGLDNYHDTVHGHEFGGLSRVVMVRKTDQRIFASAKNGEEPTYETVTKETYETFRGNKTERKVTSVEKRGVYDRLATDLRENLSPTTKTSSSSLTSKPEVKRTTDLSSFIADCLAAHNEYRSKHGVPSLKLNRQICKASQQWADILATRGKLSHSQNREYGENIYSSWSTDPNYTLAGREPVDTWYEEINKHTFGTEPTTLQSGHFTQVIWKESKEIGVALSKSKDGQFIVVVNYSPPGNCIGSFTENVPPIGGFSAKHITTDCKETAGKLVNGILKNGFTEFDLKFEEECLKAHNEYRKEHGVEPMRLNRKLCKESKEWAKHLAAKGQIEHKKYASYGQNIYSCWSSNPSYTITGKEPVDSWYSEISRHDCSREPTDLRSGHFTQVVWRASKDLGVGVEKNRNGQTFVVASYSPAGNYIGSFKENVLPKICTNEQPKLTANGCNFTPNDFATQSLKLHNDYRRKHGVPDLKLNFDMCEYAQEWVDHLAKEGKLAHRPDCRYGENIFFMWSSDPSATPTAKDVCKKWYDEIKDFTFGVESRMPKAGHFTQMVWKESYEFGIGVAKGKNNGKTFVVANYNPKGNYCGKYVTNVPKPIK